MQTIFYLVIIIVSNNSSSVQAIPQKTLYECQDNARKIDSAKLPDRQGLTLLCLSGIK